jgi:hypothetical protein
MMIKMMRSIPWGNVALFMGGAMLVAIAAPIVAFSFASLLALYDDAFPVAEAKLARAEIVDDKLRFQLYVTRRRDCETLKIEGFSGPHRLAMAAATIMKREDGLAPISYPVGVTVLSRPWMMSPLYGPHIWIYGYYDCDDRVVKQRLIDQVLP